jgi:hypothetical protein
MSKQAVLWLLAAGFCTGGACMISISPDGDSAGVPLDQATATFLIRPTDAGQAGVVASIKTRFGQTLVLSQDQSVSVNGVALTGPGEGGLYSATLPLAAAYTITVSEPTRGVQDTVVAAPAEFSISEPADGAAASLSGFALAWTAADPNQKATIALRQTLFEIDRTRELGPFPDNGSANLSAEDLQIFQQGALITVTLTKLSQRTSIDGFSSAKATVELSTSISVNPSP